MIGARVLVAEGERPVAEELQGRLERMGLTVAAVSSAEDALRTAERTAPDLVLMALPLQGGLDGRDAAAQIRERCDIPVVYFTAYPDEAPGRAPGRRDGSSGYLRRPFGERDLRLAIDTALQRHALERRARESEGRLAAVLASVADAVIIADAEGCVLALNPAAEVLTGWARADARGRALGQLFRLVDEATSTSAECPAGKALRTGAAARLAAPALLLGRGGGPIPVEGQATPTPDARGQTGGVVLVLRDLREQRRAEEQLRQAQKMEAVGRLASGVAHDINNMMTVVLGYGDALLAQLRPEDPLRAMVEEVKRAGERSAAITRQLLVFSRKQALAPAAVNLNETVAGAERMLRRLLGADVQLVSALEPNLGCVRADRGQLEQVVLNLAINARDAMPCGGRLAIATRSLRVEEAGGAGTLPLRPGEYAVLSVSDSGVGMDEATRLRIFEPFFTTKEAGKGTGLGLATVHAVVEQNGGHIEVDSSPGRGTSFRVYLPRLREAAAPAAEVSQKAGAGGHETVLLAEDDAGVRSLARAVLQHGGYTVLEAADGAEALRLCRQGGRPVQLLLSDAIMPNMSGPELARRVRELHPEVKVLFISGYPEDTLTRHGAGAAGLAFLPKPFTTQALAAKVREVLDGG